MLKLKRSRKNNEIHIQIRQPLRLFDRYFLLALVAAFAIHLFAAFLFHVRLFSFGEIETVLPATKAYAHFVKGSAQESDAIVSTQINLEGRLTLAHLIPPESMPTLYPLEPSLSMPSIEYSETQENNPFSAIEKDVEDSYFANLEIPVVTPPVKVMITGALAEIPMQDFKDEISHLFAPLQFSAQNLHQERIVYSVQMDTNTGQIFWFEPLESSLNSEQTTLTENLLKSIFFQSNPDHFVQSGQVEFIFTWSDV